MQKSFNNFHSRTPFERCVWGADFETFNYPANGNHPQSLSQQMQQFVNNEAAAKHCHHQRHPYQMIVYYRIYLYTLHTYY